MASTLRPVAKRVYVLEQMLNQYITDASFTRAVAASLSEERRVGPFPLPPPSPFPVPPPPAPPHLPPLPPMAATPPSCPREVFRHRVVDAEDLRESAAAMFAKMRDEIIGASVEVMSGAVRNLEKRCEFLEPVHKRACFR